MSSTATTSAGTNKTFNRRFFNGRPARFPMLLVMVMSLLLANFAQPTSVRAQAASTVIKSSVTFPFSLGNGCTGEDVSGVVSVKTTIQSTRDANGGFEAHFLEVFHGTAVGEISGIQYVAPATDHESFHVSSGGALEDTYTAANFRFLSRGSAGNILTHFLFHTTITPNGDVKSEISNITDECIG